MGRTIVSARDTIIPQSATEERARRRQIARDSGARSSGPDGPDAFGIAGDQGSPAGREETRAIQQFSAASPDTYAQRLFKYVPAESVALYLTLAGIVRTSSTGTGLKVGLLLVGAFVLAFTPLYLIRVAKVTKRNQVVLSSVSFVVWTFAIGGVFATMSWYKPSYGSIALVAATALIPLVDPTSK